MEINFISFCVWKGEKESNQTANEEDQNTNLDYTRCRTLEVIRMKSVERSLEKLSLLKSYFGFRVSFVATNWTTNWRRRKSKKSPHSIHSVTYWCIFSVNSRWSLGRKICNSESYFQWRKVSDLFCLHLKNYKQKKRFISKTSEERNNF